MAGRELHRAHFLGRLLTDDQWNFQLLCGHSNSVKGKKTQAEFAALMNQKKKDFSWI